MAINAPAAKAVINPSLFLNLATNKPPANVERKRPCLNKMEADLYQLNIWGEKTSHTNKKHYADYSRKGHDKGTC